MFRTTIACLVLLGTAAPIGSARADGEPAAAPAIAGTYAFDWFRPHRSRCTKVKGALLRKLQRATCKLPDTGTSSGRPLVAVCTAKGSEWLVFASADDCKEERETQLINGA